MNEPGRAAQAHVGGCDAPALFLHAEDDALVGLAHVEALVRDYGGPRVLAVVEGTHSSPRAKRTLDFVGKFLARYLGCAGAAIAAPERVPWVAADHRLTRVSGLAYALDGDAAAVPPAA